MAITATEAQNRGTKTTQNGKATGVNAETVIRALSELYSSDEAEHGTCYTINELCDHMGVKPTPQAARAFVAATADVHFNPAEFLQGKGQKADIVRRKLHNGDTHYCDGEHEGSCYHNWAFGFVTKSQIGKTWQNSGFEGNANHEVGNRVNADLNWSYLPIKSLSESQQQKLGQLQAEQGDNDA